MREIEFRGYYAGDLEFPSGWVYGYFIGGKESSIMTRDGHMCWSVEPESIGQFTGLTDKHGTKIFEGDIVVQDGYLWFDEGKPNYRGTVEWVFCAWQVIAHCVSPDKCGISDGINSYLDEDGNEGETNSGWTVLGNIYENSDLLNAN